MGKMYDTLTDDLQAFVSKKATEGSYANADDYISNLLREEKERDEKRRADANFRAFVQKGLDSPDCPDRVTDVLAEAKKIHKAQTA